MNAAIAQQVVAAQLMNVAAAMESQLDDQIHKLDNLGEDDLDAIRRRRLESMKRAQAKRAEWLARGHGTYEELLDEKAFFAAMKGTERMVCHFYRENWPCKVMDKHLAILAAKHVETRFCKINAEKSPFLVERLKIWMLPTLALCKLEKTIDYVVGLDDLGGKDDFTTEMLAARLGAPGIIHYEGGDVGMSGRPKPAPVARTVRQGGRETKGMAAEDDENSDFDD